VCKWSTWDRRRPLKSNRFASALTAAAAVRFATDPDVGRQVHFDKGPFIAPFEAGKYHLSRRYAPTNGTRIAAPASAALRSLATERVDSEERCPMFMVRSRLGYAMRLRRLADFPYVAVRLRCDVCKRAGAYRLARLAVKYGTEILLDDLIVRLSSDCL
jgi:hypothetical protein